MFFGTKMESGAKFGEVLQCRTVCPEEPEEGVRPKMEPKQTQVDELQGTSCPLAKCIIVFFFDGHTQFRVPQAI